MTADTHEDLRALAGKATPGEWRRYHEEQVLNQEGGRVCKAFFERDAAFIEAANPSRVIALLDEIRLQRSALNEAKTLCEAVIRGERLSAIAVSNGIYTSICAALAGGQDHE